jgi:hypothetical protein
LEKIDRDTKEKFYISYWPGNTFKGNPCSNCDTVVVTKKEPMILFQGDYTKELEACSTIEECKKIHIKFG